MKTTRVQGQIPALAGVYYVRTETMVKGFDISLDQEFDEQDTFTTRYILVEDDRMPVGTCRIHITSEDTAKIERVSVIPSYQHKGVGSLAIKGAEEWLKDLGVKKIVITSREAAVDFYLKNGYVKEDHEKEGSGLFTLIYVSKEI